MGEALASREQVFNVIESRNDVEASVVAFEKGSQAVRSSMQVFIRTKVKLDEKGVLEWFENVICFNNVRFFRVKSERTILIRISATDYDLLHKGIDVASLAFTWQVYNVYLRAMDKLEFNTLHTFECRHLSKWKQLEAMVSQFKENQRFHFVLRQVENVDCFNGWRKEVLTLFNSIVLKLASGNCKKSTIFIEGPPDVGKTYFVYELMKEFFQNEQVYEPYTTDKGVNDFTWSTFMAERHSIVVDNEFKLSRYDVELLKKLMEGLSVKVRQLYGKPREIRARVPFFFLSNRNIEQAVKRHRAEGFLQRINFVRADGPVMTPDCPVPVFFFRDVVSVTQGDTSVILASSCSPLSISSAGYESMANTSQNLSSSSESSSPQRLPPPLLKKGRPSPSTAYFQRNDALSSLLLTPQSSSSNSRDRAASVHGRKRDDSSSHHIQSQQSSPFNRSRVVSSPLPLSLPLPLPLSPPPPPPLPSPLLPSVPPFDASEQSCAVVSPPNRGKTDASQKSFLMVEDDAFGEEADSSLFLKNYSNLTVQEKDLNQLNAVPSVAATTESKSYIFSSQSDSDPQIAAYSNYFLF